MGEKKQEKITATVIDENIIHCPRCGEGTLESRDCTQIHGSLMDMSDQDDNILVGLVWECSYCQIVYLDVPEISSIWGDES